MTIELWKRAVLDRDASAAVHDVTRFTSDILLLIPVRTGLRYFAMLLRVLGVVRPSSASMRLALVVQFVLALVAWISCFA